MWKVDGQPIRGFKGIGLSAQNPTQFNENEER